MNLGVVVLDKQMLDVNHRRCGKVDDLLLETNGEGCLAVKAIISQTGALARDMGPWMSRIMRGVYRLLGITDPHPVYIDWDLVTKIDVVVHLSKSREELGLQRLQNAISQRIIGRIPGA